MLDCLEVDYLKNKLPSINKKADNYDSKVFAISILRGKIYEIINSYSDLNISIEDARKKLSFLGFLISSLEKHSQENGNEVGEAIKNINQLENKLIILGKKANHPPRDSLYTYSIWNTDNITFSGDYAEKLFIEIVRNSTNILYKSVNLLLEEYPYISKNTINEIRNNVNDVKTEFKRYLSLDDNGHPVITAKFFMNTLRQYNCSWKINGDIWKGPTAANCMPYIAMDYLLNLNNKEYDEHVKNRLRYLSEEDKMNLINIIGLEKSKKIILEDEQGFKNLKKDWYNLSKFHFGLINKFLIKPQHNDIKNKAIVDNEKGTSGMSFEEVKKIRDMRKI